MDFGLAKLKGALKITRTSTTAGTLAYMAPEQIQGGAVDARSSAREYRNSAKTLKQIGDQERALDVLDRLLAISSELPRGLLRADPTWTALRTNKQFQEILRQKPS
jgi:serine/threonine protein kinase